MIGQQIDKYHILEQLGEGGMAQVYLAMDMQLKRSVAIKILRAAIQNNEKTVKRFELEAQALAKLNHPNIVQVIDYGDYEGNPYLVMEHVAGGNLKQKLNKPIHWQEAARILAPIASALADAHKNNIIHRDVKPANILLRDDGTPLLTDFGIAKILEMEETLDLTGTSMGVGTPYYMAPEQSQSGAVSPKLDIYALGVVFYEMVTGRKPYQADTPMAVMLMHMQDPIPRPRKFNKDVSSNVERVLFKALAKDPAQRWNTMDEFAAVLADLGAGRKVSVKRRVSRRVLAGVGIIGLLAASIWMTNKYWATLFPDDLPISPSVVLAENSETPVPGATSAVGALDQASTLVAEATQTEARAATMTAYITTVRPSNTPKPTATLIADVELPVPVLNQFPQALIAEYDNFEYLISKYWALDTPDNISFEEGVLKLNGVPFWAAGFSQRGSEPNNWGVLFGIEFSGDVEANLFLDRGSFDTDGYLRWGINVANDSGRLFFSRDIWLGSGGFGGDEIGNFQIRSDTLYYVFIGITENNEFLVMVWPKDQPAQVAIELEKNMSDTWSNRRWKIGIGANQGQLRFHEYYGIILEPEK